MSYHGNTGLSFDIRKQKYHPKTILENNDIVTINVTFKYYSMNTDDDKLLQGYYAKITSYEEDKENKN